MKNLNKKKRPVCGVVAAEANSIEQRQIIEGIVSQNQLYGIDTAVISNIYNPNVKEQELYCENRIYELILSEDLDSIILISESKTTWRMSLTISSRSMALKISIC